MDAWYGERSVVGVILYLSGLLIRESVVVMELN